MSQKLCSKCGVAFECCNETRGCWCESLHISKETLEKLRVEYDNCLCKKCLSEIEQREQL